MNIHGFLRDVNIHKLVQLDCLSSKITKRPIKIIATLNYFSRKFNMQSLDGRVIGTRLLKLDFREADRLTPKSDSMTGWILNLG